MTDPEPLIDPPDDPLARVVDRDGDVWAGVIVDVGHYPRLRLWGCQTTASTIQHWHDLRNVCGPLLPWSP